MTSSTRIADRTSRRASPRSRVCLAGIRLEPVWAAWPAAVAAGALVGLDGGSGRHGPWARRSVARHRRPRGKPIGDVIDTSAEEVTELLRASHFTAARSYVASGSHSGLRAGLVGVDS